MIIICNAFRTFLLARLSIFIIFYANPLFYANFPSYSPSYANPNSSSSYSTSSIPTSSAFPSSSSIPTSSALSNPIPELILALLGSAMRPGSFWRRLVRLFVQVRLGTTWTCYSSWLILAMIRSVICPGRTWHCFVRCHATDINQHSTFETICLRHSQSVRAFSLM